MQILRHIAEKEQNHFYLASGTQPGAHENAMKILFLLVRIV